MKRLFLSLCIIALSFASNGQRITANELIRIRYMKFGEAQKFVLSKGFKLVEKDTSVKGYTILMFQAIGINNSKKIFVKIL